MTLWAPIEMFHLISVSTLMILWQQLQSFKFGWWASDCRYYYFYDHNGKRDVKPWRHFCLAAASADVEKRRKSYYHYDSLTIHFTKMPLLWSEITSKKQYNSPAHESSSFEFPPSCTNWINANWYILHMMTISLRYFL